MGGSGMPESSLVEIYRFKNVPVISIGPSGYVAARGLDSGHRASCGS